jgi:nicotinate-nucleotide--dimethylbenzimidazole phosphoribosyltransferase
VAPGTRNYIEEAAMTPAERDTAIARGAALARELAANGCKVLGFGEMGIGNTAAASLITHYLTSTPLDECIGRGTGLDDPGLARKRALLKQAAKRAGLPADAKGSSEHAQAVLAEFGGFEIAMMTGAMLGAAEAGMVLLIDGFIVGAAFLVAARIEPNIQPYAVFCHRSAEPGHQAQLKALDAEPLIDLGLRLGEGTGAALAAGQGGGGLPQRDGQRRIGRRRQQVLTNKPLLTQRAQRRRDRRVPRLDGLSLRPLRLCDLRVEGGWYFHPLRVARSAAGQSK